MQKSKSDQDRCLGNFRTALPKLYNQFMKAIIMVKPFTLPLIQLKPKKAGHCIIHIVTNKSRTIKHLHIGRYIGKDYGPKPNENVSNKTLFQINLADKEDSERKTVSGRH